MNIQLLFATSVVQSLVAWGVVTGLYVWPFLRNRARADALRPLLVLNAFRFMGLSFLIPGVASADLPLAFARDAAFGDLLTAGLALLALLGLRSRWSTVLAWVFNLWGTADILNAFFRAGTTGLAPGQFGAAYFIPTVFVPLLLIMHGLVFRILLRPDSPNSPLVAAPSRPVPALD